MAKKSKQKKEKASEVAKTQASLVSNNAPATAQSFRLFRIGDLLIIFTFLIALITLVAFGLANFYPTSPNLSPNNDSSTVSASTMSDLVSSSVSSVIMTTTTRASVPPSITSNSSNRGNQGINASENTSTSVPAQNQSSTSSGSVSSGVAGSSTTASYTFTASRGESVSKLSRKAIHQYLQERGVALNRAQRLFMEVNLTNANNPKWMEIGETRTFSVSQISDLYNQSVGLSASQMKAWERQAATAGYR